jgi:hypothetical protein
VRAAKVVVFQGADRGAVVSPGRLDQRLLLPGQAALQQQDLRFDRLYSLPQGAEPFFTIQTAGGF